MVLGYAWYSPALFGRTWMTLIGKPEAELKSGSAGAMGGMIVMAALTAVTIGLLFSQTNFSYLWTDGLWFGLIVAVGLILPIMATRVLFERAPMKLFWINFGYQLVSLSLMGIIFGAWPK